MWKFFCELVKAREEWLKQRRKFPNSAPYLSNVNKYKN